MNSQKHRSFILLASMIVATVVLLASLAGVAYAAWSVQDETDTQVSTTSLAIEVLTDTSTPLPQYPGADITRDVSVQNIGEAPVFVRIKIASSFVDADGQTVADPAGFISVVFDTTHWKDGEDGYYYLKGVLAPGATSASCIESVTLSPSISNELAGCTVLVTPQAEALQITSSAVLAVWKKTYEFMEARSPEPRDMYESSITFVNPQTGFAFVPDTKDIYPGAKELTPGETITHSVTLANTHNEAVDVVVSSGVFAPDEHTKLFSQYVMLSITDAEGSVIFSGPAAGAEWDAFAHTLVLEPHAIVTWEIALAIHPDASNDLQNIQTNILSWELKAQGHSDDPPAPTPQPSPGSTPLTGDRLFLLVCALTACISGTALLILAFCYRRHKGGREL